MDKDQTTTLEDEASQPPALLGDPLPDRIVQNAEFCKAFLGGASEATEWRERQAGKLPPRIKVGGRVIGRRLSDCLAWLAALPTEDPARDDGA